MYEAAALIVAIPASLYFIMKIVRSITAVSTLKSVGKIVASGIEDLGKYLSDDE